MEIFWVNKPVFTCAVRIEDKAALNRGFAEGVENGRTGLLRQRFSNVGLRGNRNAVDEWDRYVLFLTGCEFSSSGGSGFGVDHPIANDGRFGGFGLNGDDSLFLRTRAGGKEQSGRRHGCGRADERQ